MVDRPVVLDFDGSVGTLPDEIRLPLADWQELIRFGCAWQPTRALGYLLDAQLPRVPGPVLLGSGDFHHISLLLIARLARREPLQVVVLDNHPDNMRFAFGIHCGSWIHHVAALPGIEHVYVLGITSGDVALAHSWENHLRPLWQGKLSYWCLDVDVGWATWLGLGHAIRCFSSPEAMLAAWELRLRQSALPVYFSIDKDVLDPQVAMTNWDQGQLCERHALDAIALCQGRIIGCDITGEVSAYRYRSAWKRLLSAWDGQTPISPTQLADWQRQQHALDLRLLAALQAAQR